MGYLIILSFYEKAISKNPLEKVSICNYGMKRVKIKRGEEKMKDLRGWPFGPPGDLGVMFLVHQTSNPQSSVQMEN